MDMKGRNWVYLIICLSGSTIDQIIPGRVAQSVMCLSIDACLTADHKLDPGPVPYFRGD